MNENKRRERYATKIWEDNSSRPWTMTNEHEQKRYRAFADSAMAVSDSETDAENDRLRAELRGTMEDVQVANATIERVRAVLDSVSADPNVTSALLYCRIHDALDGG